MRSGTAIILTFFACLISTCPSAAADTAVDVLKVEPQAEVRFDTAEPGVVKVEWPAGEEMRAVATLRLKDDGPLIKSLALQHGSSSSHEIANDLAPFFAITVGTRNLDTPGGWTIFFDKVPTRPFQRYGADLQLKTARAEAKGARGSLSLGKLTAGPFSGELVFRFCAGSPLIQAEAAVSTQEDRRAIIYDAGLVAMPGKVERFAWSDYDNQTKSQPASQVNVANSIATQCRTVVAELSDGGTVAIFPPPHQFLYPLDFADNFGFNWLGRDYPSAPRGDGWGVRQPPEGDRRFVPWINAPPGSLQRLSVFYLMTGGKADDALAIVKDYTHADQYLPLPGYKTFTSHYHIEHTLDLLKRKAARGTSEIPPELQVPDFRRVFKSTGVDIVHLAEFHNGQTPKLGTEERLRQLRTMHSECARLSDEQFLLIPGEEPNVHLGGHWISLFPKPVLWVLNRPEGKPFVEQNSAGEAIYHVGDAADVLKLMELEHGLMWTAHARIKSSVGFPDGYKDQEFFKSPHFLGAAWKAMPADLSRDTLGWRVLDLLDDMNQWNGPKQAIGEVDIFQVRPGYEFYGHANINYVQLDKLPRYSDGWTPLLTALRAGRFFTTTGEILITDFANSPPTTKLRTLRVRLNWTLPLSHAEIVGGDGKRIVRQRIELTDTREHGERDFTAELPGEFDSCRWVRLSVWDIAADGAFTQPIWLTE